MENTRQRSFEARVPLLRSWLFFVRALGRLLSGPFLASWNDRSRSARMDVPFPRGGWCVEMGHYHFAHSLLRLIRRGWRTLTALLFTVISFIGHHGTHISILVPWAIPFNFGPSGGLP